MRERGRMGGAERDGQREKERETDHKRGKEGNSPGGRHKLRRRNSVVLHMIPGKHRSDPAVPWSLELRVDSSYHFSLKC